jgi:hypothetical protein
MAYIGEEDHRQRHQSMQTLGPQSWIVIHRRDLPVCDLPVPARTGGASSSRNSRRTRRGGSLRTKATPPPRTIWGKRTPPAGLCRPRESGRPRRARADRSGAMDCNLRLRHQSRTRLAAVFYYRRLRAAEPKRN